MAMRRIIFAAIVVVTLPLASKGAESPTITRDVVYGHKDGLAMTLDVIQPPEPNGAGVMFIVSGGWFSNWFPPESVIRESQAEKGGFASLVDAGFTLFLVRHGSAPKYKVPDAVSDVRRAVRHIRFNHEQFGVDPNRLGVFGGSAGGHLSLMLGTTAEDGMDKAADPIVGTSSRVAAVVAYFPPTDLREIIGPSKSFPALEFDPGLGESVSPLLHVTDDDAPTLLIHGDRDELVPLSHSENIKKAFEEKQVVHELIIIEGAAHGFRGDAQKRATKSMVEWFETHLVGRHKAAAK